MAQNNPPPPPSSLDDLWKSQLAAFTGSPTPKTTTSAASVSTTSSPPVVVVADSISKKKTDDDESAKKADIKDITAITARQTEIIPSRRAGPVFGPNERLTILFDNCDFLREAFQIDLYEAGKRRDAIIFLRFDKGKHFLAVMLIKYFTLKSLAGGPSPSLPAAIHTEPRKVFILTKNLNSICYYASLFRAHTNYRVLEHIETEDPELGGKLPWSYEQWRDQFLENDIHLMLGLTFERLLEKGYFGVEHIQLLVLDDVQKIIITKDGEEDEECYTRVMRTLRAKGLKSNSADYRVIGLSASLFLEDVNSQIFESMLQRIEQKLNCTCETYADLRMISKYHVACRIRLRYYPSQFMDHYTTAQPQIDQTQLKWSLFKIRNYTAQYYAFLSRLNDTKLCDQVSLVTQQCLSEAIIDVLYILGTLGEWCALKLIDLYNREIGDSILLFKGTKSHYVTLLNSVFGSMQLVRSSILAYLPVDIRDKLEGGQGGSRLTLQQLFLLSTPKLHLLAQLLSSYLTEMRGSSSSPIQSTFSFPANICAIVYARRRCTVRIVAAWIAELASITADTAPSHGFTYLLPDYVFPKHEDQTLGPSSNYTRKQQQKSLNKNFYYRRQEEVMKRFRLAHNCNLLVTSSMSSKGLETSRCNMVLCFDPPHSFQTYIISKGRVRTENGLFYVLVDQSDIDEAKYGDKFWQFVEIEKIFTKLMPLANELTIEAKNSQRSVRFNVDSVKAESGAVVTISDTSTSIQLTLANAISILNRYCLKLPRDVFTQLSPHYYIDSVTIPTDGIQLPGTSRYQCRLYLPINSALRDEIKGDPMTNPVMAKRSAALKAVQALQELGELDESYRPIDKALSRYIEQLDLQECVLTNEESASEPQVDITGTLTSTTKSPPPNRLKARNISAKKQVYYPKKVTNYLTTGGSCFKEVPGLEPKLYLLEHLYEFEMALTTALQPDASRPYFDPAQTKRTFGIIVPCRLPPVCDFPIYYNRSGEMTVRLRRIERNSVLSEEQISQLKMFHKYIFEDVLRLGMDSIKPAFDGDASNGNYVIVPINEITAANQRDIDWTFVTSVVKHITTDQEPAAETAGQFHFDANLYRDAIVVPKYHREKDYFYVADICHDLTPLSAFPEKTFATFAEYYRATYGQEISNREQPLLDVHQTSSKFNLLKPRHLNRKGGGLEPAKKSPNSQQKQILIPELCTIHPFSASFWRKAVCLPSMLYRLHSLLVVEELRQRIAREAKIGQADLPPGLTWPQLDFGWSRIVKEAAEARKKWEAENLAASPVLEPNEPPVVVPSQGREDVGINLERPTGSKPPIPASSPSPSPAPPVKKSGGFMPLPESVDSWSSFQSHVNAAHAGARIDILTEEPELREMLQDMVRKTKEDEEKEAAMAELDETGKPIERPVRAVSPTQFATTNLDEEEDDEEMDEEAKATFGSITPAFFTNFNWAQTPLGESDSEMITVPEEVEPEKLVTDLNTKQCILEDSAFLEEVGQGTSSNSSSFRPHSRSSGGADQANRTVIKEAVDEVEGTSDGIDFDLDDLDDDEEFFGGEDQEDEDEDEDVFGKDDESKREDLTKKKSSDDQPDAAATTKSKSAIYNTLRYELLYDVKAFERVDISPQLTSSDGSALLELDRTNRSVADRRAYERIYREEKEEVALVTETLASDLDVPLSGTEGPSTFIYAPESTVEPLDASEEVIPTSAEHRFVDVILQKFEEDDVDCLLKIGAEREELEDEEIITEEDLNGDSKLQLADYAPAEEIKREESRLTFSFDADSSKNVSTELCLGPDPSLILQALTMSNSAEGVNLERLESVGDSFLKYSMTAFLYFNCPDLPRGKLSCLRSRQICNFNLHRLGERLQLGSMMIATKFEPTENWCPPGYKVIEEPEKPNNQLTGHSIPNKSIVDSVEALIGAYLIASGSQGAIKFMDWLGLKVQPGPGTNIVDSANRRDDTWLPTPKSPLIVPKNGGLNEAKTKLMEIYQHHRLDHLEAALGYTFRDKAFLVQALTHNSYYENTVTPCYQRLEFLGDAVLDYLTTRHLYEEPQEYSPAALTNLRSTLVNNTFFARLAVKYGFNKYLLMASTELFRVVDSFVRKFAYYEQDRAEEIQARAEFADFEYGYTIQEPYWDLLIAEGEAEALEDIEVPKALGDIFASVAGAIFLDSAMSLDAVWRAYYPMIKSEIEYFSLNLPKSPIGVLMEKHPESTTFSKPKITPDRKICIIVEVLNVGRFVGIGPNKRFAACTAAKRALRALKALDDYHARRIAAMLAEQAEQEAAFETPENMMENFGFRFEEGDADAAAEEEANVPEA